MVFYISIANVCYKFTLWESPCSILQKERVVQETYIWTKVFMHGKDHWFAVPYANNYSVKGPTVGSLWDLLYVTNNIMSSVKRVFVIQCVWLSCCILVVFKCKTSLEIKTWAEGEQWGLREYFAQFLKTILIVITSRWRQNISKRQYHFYTFVWIKLALLVMRPEVHEKKN